MMPLVFSFYQKAKSLTTRTAALRLSLAALCFFGVLTAASAQAQVVVSISPTTVSVTANTTKQFTSTVTGTTNVGVKWSVDGVVAGASSTGTISTSGVYTAPAAAGSHTVTATSNADSTQSASAAVTVTVVAVSISPTSVSIAANATKQFAASVTGTTNTGVKWYVDGVLGGDAATGTITTGGLYTAPATAGAHTVSITSNADTTKSASSAVTVTTIAVSISPTSASVAANTTKQFSATVTGTTNTGVQWSVDGVTGGNSTVGTISTGGLYTAPAVAGTHTVTITSNADSTKTASATVTVTAVAVSLSPTSASISTGSTKQFTATVTGTTNTGVLWSVDTVTGGNSTVGTISTAGLYTAPSTAGTHTVTITSNADTTKTASATVTVTGVAISLSPISASVNTSSTKQFTATVTGSTNTGVTWYVDGVLNGSSTSGTISTAGLYTAPSTAGTHTVSVNANADSTQSASATVTVTTATPVSISISPTTATVIGTQTKQFISTVTGTTNVGVKWYVDGTQGGTDAAGNISTAGMYLAPNLSGTHTVTIVSNADTTKSASATVTVTGTIWVQLMPYDACTAFGGTQQFTATVAGTTNQGVTWQVDGVTGGSSSVGTINPSGVYTAPSTVASHTIKAISQASTSKTVSVTVAVSNTVSLAFGNRTASTFAIPAEMMGNNLTNLTDPNGMALLTEAGMVHTRIYSNIQTIFTSKTTADWTKIDPIVTKLHTAGIRPMLQITYTPGFLVPVVSGCTPSYKMPPTDYVTYGNLAAQIVAHMDKTFPGFVVDYEIWNEPDLATFCTNPSTDAQRMSVYLSLYAAAASAMKTQAAADGQTIRIGGPTTVSTAYLNWVPALTSNPTTAPYVDFVSYHQYPSGTTQIQAGMTWDTPHGSQTLYSITQSNFASWFTSVSKLVHAGKQPNAASTPVYVSEWNDGWPFMLDCCRNDPTYAPVMNGLMILDYMNTVYSGSGALPGKLFYYSASAFPYFCMIGVWDSQMTCQYPAGSTPVPYPSYHPYNLVSSPNYLGLVNGGNMAVSVTPGTTSSGLAATAFYTGSKDAILIVNPTSTSYSGVNVTFNNAGLPGAQGTYYLIEGPNNTIVTLPVTLTTTSGGYNASVDIPPYSVIAVGIQ